MLNHFYNKEKRDFINAAVESMIKIANSVDPDKPVSHKDLLVDKLATL